MATILITGANRGLGLEFTQQHLAAGDTVIATRRRPDPEGVLEGLEGALHVVPLDVAKRASIKALPRAVTAVTDHLDVVINNAGINHRGVKPHQANMRFGLLEPEGILEMINVNAIGPLLIAQALVDLLASGTDPKVINISSQLGSISDRQRGGNYGYCTSKAALNMMTRTLAHDLARRDIAVAALNPGWVQTDMGGERAALAPAESVAGMRRVIAALDMAQTGRFFQWDGAELDW